MKNIFSNYWTNHDETSSDRITENIALQDVLGNVRDLPGVVIILFLGTAEPDRLLHHEIECPRDQAPDQIPL